MNQRLKPKPMLVVMLWLTSALAQAQTIIYKDAYDLTNGFTLEGSFSITDESTPTDIAFSADGTKMYIVGKFNDEVFQYSLSAPFDLTATVTLDGSSSVAVASQENPTGLAFNDDGTVLFTIGDEYNRILSWNLSTPFDITDGLVQAGTAVVSSFEATPEAIAFSSDGNRRYVLGRSGDDINQTNNSSPYSLTTGTAGAFSIASETLAPYGMAVSGDDRILLVSSYPNVIQYSLSTPGEVISGVSLDEVFFNFPATMIPQGIAYNADGTRFYVLTDPSSGTATVAQYSINTADENFTESDLADGSVDGSATIRISGETFSAPGSNLVSGTDFSITNLPAGLVPVMAVSADGKVATLTFSGNAISSQDSDDVESLVISFTNSAFTGNDASSVANAMSASTGFGINFTTSKIIYASPADIQSGITLDQTADISGQDALYNLDGTKLFVLGETGDNVTQYSLSTPFSITSGLSLDGMFDLGNEESTPTGFYFSNNGSKMFVVGSAGDDVNQYGLSDPFDVTATVSFEGSYSISSQENNPQGISFSTDGYKMFIVGHQSDEVNQYTLTNSFDITSGVSFDGTPLVVSSIDLNPTDLTFNADGTRLFVVGYSQKDINQYHLSNPFDITSGVTFEAESFPDLQFDFTPLGLSLSPDGLSFLVINTDIAQYNFDNSGFVEAAANDGSLDGTIVLKLINASFSNAGGTLTHGSDFNIINLPAGLIPGLAVDTDGMIATLTLDGNATNSHITDNLSDLTFTFENSAFTNGNASAIDGTDNASSNMSISFTANPSLTYGFEAFDFDAGPIFDGSTSLSPQVASGDNVAFNEDGTRIFVTNTSSQIFQFDLSVPFDITSTVSFNASKTLSTSQRGIAFSTDGTKMFELRTFNGGVQPAVIEYSLSVPFDISSTFTLNNSYTIIAQENSPLGITLSEDGTKMYIVGGAGLNQYTLSTAYSLASVSHDGNEAISGNPSDIKFNSDGSMMFILGTSFDNVARYSLSIPFDVTAGFVSAGDAFSVSAQNNSPNGLAFSNDGGRMFMVGSGSHVYQYSIDAGGFNETAENSGEVEGSLTIRLSGGLFSNAGGNLSGSDYTINNLPENLASNIAVAADGLSAEVTLSGTAEDHQNTDDLVSLNFTFENSAFANHSAGDVLNAVDAESNFGIDFDDNARLVYGFEAFDLDAGATNDGSPYSFSNEEGNPGGIAFSDDGMKLFVVGLANDNVNQYTLTDAYDITTAVSYDGSASVATQETNPTGIQFSADGFKMFVIGATGDDVNQYSLSSAYDITSTVLFEGNYSISSEESAPQDLVFNPDGTKMFVVGSTGDDVNQYSLSTPFDITGTVTFDGSPFSVAAEETVPSAIAFKNDGMKMFILGISGDDINQYDLDTPFDITDGVNHETTYSVASEETSPTGLVFSADGSKFFVIGQTGDDINQYTVNQEKFTESTANDGSVDGSLTIQIFSDTFTNASGSLSGSDYSIHNLPSGLTSSLVVASDGRSATLTLGGNATNNSDTHDVASLQFTFENSAFASTAAADVINAVGAESNAGIDFIGDELEAITWDGSDWSNITGPSAADDVIVNGDFSGAFVCANLTVSSGIVLTVEGTLDVKEDLTNDGSIIVSSGFSLITYAGNSVTGNDIEIRRETRYGDGRYSFVGSPVEQNAATTASDLGAHVYTYDESLSTDGNDVLRWVASADTDELVPGTGYTQAKKRLLKFYGVPNTGEIVVNGNFTGTYNDGINEAAEGWNLVSNPYATAINVSDFLAGNPNIEGAVYIWDDNGSNNGRGTNADYIIANGTVATNTTPAGGHSRYNQHIGLAQAFFVKLTDHVDTGIGFTEDMRVSGNNSDENFFRQTTTPAHVRLNLTNSEGLFKQTIVGWLPGISDEQVDRSFDARVFSSSAPDLIYTLKGDVPLAIQGIGYQREVVLLGCNVSVDGLYTLAIDDESAQGQSIYLKDKQTEEVLDLRIQPYTFSASAGQITDRFELISNFNILDSRIQEVEVFSFNRTLYIRSNGRADHTFKLVNLSGQQMWTGEVGQKAAIDLSHLSSGVYIVTDGAFSHKIILK